MTKKLFVLAGEVSGDMHAADAIRELLEKRPDIRIFGIGGDRLRALGAELMYDTRQMSIMGFVDVLKHAIFLKRVIREVKKAVRTEKPDAAFLVDYPGLNLMMAAFFRKLGIPVIFYVSPQVWAWRERRVNAIRRDIDRLMVIFDFEVDFYRRHGMEVDFVGHPVVEQLSKISIPSSAVFRETNGIGSGTKLIGLLPGSRRQELACLFREMLEAARLLNSRYRVVFLLGRAPNLPEECFGILSEYPELSIIECSAYEVMQNSDLAVITSGTATLEALCFGVPMIVVYRTGRLNYQIARRVAKVKNISLANIVSKGLQSSEQLVPELLQDDVRAEKIFEKASAILDDPDRSAGIRQGLLAARARLGHSFPSKKVAGILQEYL
ncbi:MAG: lipid-A-disaccharide synthase [Chlorobiaceae bacterium]|nr:lipid-A-disaccharide synthase [Chlorobiaceae bacterium]